MDVSSFQTCFYMKINKRRHLHDFMTKNFAVVTNTLSITFSKVRRRHVQSLSWQRTCREHNRRLRSTWSQSRPALSVEALCVLLCCLLDYGRVCLLISTYGVVVASRYEENIRSCDCVFTDNKHNALRHRILHILTSVCYVSVRGHLAKMMKCSRFGETAWTRWTLLFTPCVSILVPGTGLCVFVFVHNVGPLCTDFASAMPLRRPSHHNQTKSVLCVWVAAPEFVRHYTRVGTFINTMCFCESNCPLLSLLPAPTLSLGTILHS